MTENEGVAGPSRIATAAERPSEVRGAGLTNPVHVLHLLAVGMLLTLVVGLALMPIAGQAWALPVIAAVPILCGVGLVGLLYRVHPWSARHRVVAAVLVATVVGLIAGLVIFPPWSFGAFGVLICVPIAIVAALLGALASALISRLPAVGAIAIVAGSLFLSACIVLSFILY